MKAYVCWQRAGKSWHFVRFSNADSHPKAPVRQPLHSFKDAGPCVAPTGRFERPKWCDRSLWTLYHSNSLASEFQTVSRKSPKSVHFSMADVSIHLKIGFGINSIQLYHQLQASSLRSLQDGQLFLRSHLPEH